MPTWEQLALLLLIAAILIAAIVVIVSRVVRRTPQERERRRRLWVSQTGRLGDATVTEVQENTIYYSYSVRGVYYTAAQDVAQLREFLPEEPERLIGPVALKYATNNPANSILLCEEWTGLRPRARADTATE